MAQATHQAVLIDEFGHLPCDDMLGRVDNLAAEIQKDGSTAAIIVHEPKSGPPPAQARRGLISSTLQLRGIAKTRFSFFLAGKSEDGEIRTAFWKIPLGATPPIDKSKLWNEPTPDISHSFMFGYEQEIGICPTYVPAGFAKLVLDNPGSVGRIVVILAKRPLVDRLWFAGEFIDELVKKQGVPRKRLRLVFSKGDDTRAKFWFVPARKE